MSARPHRIKAFGISIAATLMLAPGASAGGVPSTFNVNIVADEIDANAADDLCLTAGGMCSLRAAVMQANQMTSTSTIVLPAGTYALTIPPSGGNGADSGDLNLTTGGDVINISGSGAATTIIDADQINDRVFLVHASRTANISGVTLRNGSAATGGGIRNEGTLEVSYCTIGGGTATDGAGIYNFGGAVTLNDSTLSGNDAGDRGGGIFNYGGDFKVYRSTISGNEAVFGGGVYNYSNATLYVTSSTISGNRSLESGGGIFDDGTVWTYNATIAFNHADSDDDFEGNGGGVFIDVAASFRPRNTVMAGNQVSHVSDVDCFGLVGTYGHDWFGTYNNCTPVAQTDTAVSSLIASLAELGPLRSNGGPTKTHALEAGSSIIDSGIACQEAFGPLLVDQRGGTRGVGTACDPGAFEFGALPAGLIFADGFELGNLWAWG